MSLSVILCDGSRRPEQRGTGPPAVQRPQHTKEQRVNHKPKYHREVYAPTTCTPLFFWETVRRQIAVHIAPWSIHFCSLNKFNVFIGRVNLWRCRVVCGEVAHTKPKLRQQKGRPREYKIERLLDDPLVLEASLWKTPRQHRLTTFKPCVRLFRSEGPSGNNA